MCLKATKNYFCNCSYKDLFKLNLIYINTLIHIYVKIKIKSKSHIILIMTYYFSSCNRKYTYIEKNIILIKKLLKNIL